MKPRTRRAALLALACSLALCLGACPGNPRPNTTETPQHAAWAQWSPWLRAALNVRLDVIDRAAEEFKAGRMTGTDVLAVASAADKAKAALDVLNTALVTYATGTSPTGLDPVIIEAAKRALRAMLEELWKFGVKDDNLRAAGLRLAGGDS